MFSRLAVCCVAFLALSRTCSADEPPSVPNYGWSDRFAGDPTIFPDDSGTACITALDLGKNGPSLVCAQEGPTVQRWTGNSWDPLGIYTRSGFRALEIFDIDRNGPSPPQLYAGRAVGDPQPYELWYLDNNIWRYVENGINGNVRALALFDDGEGLALYAGGTFNLAGGLSVSNVVRWDGSQWNSLGSGVGGQDSGDAINAMVVLPSATGPKLVVGGGLRIAGGHPANCVAAWDGHIWSALGQGIGGSNGQTEVKSLAIFDDGSGPKLCAGGSFSSAGGVAANNVAEWDGQTWSAIGSGTNGAIWALSSFVTQSGPRLAASGNFSVAGITTANRVAQWDGSNWLAMGDGLGDPSYGDEYVHALQGWQDDLGHELVAGGYFYLPSSYYSGKNIAAWNGSNWNEFYFEEKQNGFGITDYVGIPLQCFATLDQDGVGPRSPILYVGGYLWYDGNHAATVPINGVAKWVGNGWDGLGNNGSLDGGGEYGLNVRAMLAMDDDGPGPIVPALYVAGSFDTADGQPAANVARWDERTQTWSALGSGVKEMARALAVWDRGDGPVLYVGGHFTLAGDQPADYIAAWDPRAETWTSLDSGMDAQVNAITIFNDGSGEALYAGGRFTMAGGQACAGIAKWDGETWTPVGAGMGGEYPAVYVLKAYDDGIGPALYAGGLFETAGGLPANYIARWNGKEWSNVGSGLFGGLPADIYNGVLALEEFDDGSGRALYAQGYFTTTGAGELDAVGLAKWDGTRWSQVGGGLRFADYYPASATQGLISFDDGSGPALWVAGFFTQAGDMPSGYVARWQPVPPRISLEPQSVSICEGLRASLSVKSTGKEPLRYQWRRYGVNLQNGGAVAGADGAVLTIDPVSFANGGSYDVVIEDDIGRVISTAAELEVFLSGASSIEPSAEMTCVGSSARFEVSPPGLAPVSYEWLKDGAIISGENGPVLIIAPATVEDSGNYEVRVDDSCGHHEATASLTVVTGSISPVITEQPAGATLASCSTESFSFHVGAMGHGMLHYTWVHNGQIVSTGTESTLTLTSVDASDSGEYKVLVSDDCGQINSEPAYLVISNIQLTQQPQSQSACVGLSAAFVVAVEGATSVQYQWLKGETPLSDNGHIMGSQTAVLTINDVYGPDFGYYSVQVVADVCSFRSQIAYLFSVESGTGDGNDDGIYDATDIQMFVGALLSDNPSAPENCRFDMNYDGLIDGADIQILIYYFTGWY